MDDLTTIAVPKGFAEWWARFLTSKWSGTLSVSFNSGDPQSWEPKPHIRRPGQTK